MLEAAVAERALFARRFDVAQHLAQGGREQSDARGRCLNGRTGLEPGRDVESTALTPPGDEIDDARTGHEDGRDHTHPQEHEDWKSKDLTERERTVLQEWKQIQRRLHKAYAAPSSVDVATTDSTHTGIACCATFSIRELRLVAACHPSSTLGSTATPRPSVQTINSASSRSASGAKCGRVRASQTVAARLTATSGAVTTTGAPTNPMT